MCLELRSPPHFVTGANRTQSPLNHVRSLLEVTDNKLDWCGVVCIFFFKPCNIYIYINILCRLFSLNDFLCYFLLKSDFPFDFLAGLAGVALPLRAGSRAIPASCHLLVEKQRQVPPAISDSPSDAF